MAGASLTAALLVNFLIGVIKLIVGTLTNSSAMRAEALHSFADTFNQILLALGIKRSTRSPNPEHPFGYSKVQFFYAFVVAILIFGISGTIAFMEGLEILLDPEHHEIDTKNFGWNIVVLLIAMILESYALYTAYSEAKTYQMKFDSESLIEAVDEMQDPVLLSLLVEDSLALGGLMIALIGVSVTYFTHEPIIDGFTSLLIGILLMVGGLLLARENKQYLVGKAVSERIQADIKNILDNYSPIQEIRQMRTMLLGPKDFILALDIQFTEDAEREDIAEHIDELEKQLIAKVPILKPNRIFIEAQ